MKPGMDYIGVGVGAFIVNENQELLLLKRGKAPEKRYWCIPGGKVEWFETFEEAVKREIKEEVGVEIIVIGLLGICDHILPKENSHWIAPSYLCQITKGEPQNREVSKHEDMKWFSLEELPEDITITTKKAFADYQKMKQEKGTDKKN